MVSQGCHAVRSKSSAAEIGLSCDVLETESSGFTDSQVGDCDRRRLSVSHEEAVVGGNPASLKCNYIPEVF